MKLRSLFSLVILSVALLAMFGCGGDGGGGAAAPTAAQQFTIFANMSSVNGGLGTVTPSGGNAVNQGANQTFTFAPYSSNSFLSNVVVDAGTANEVSLGAVPSHTFTNVTANHTINAIFLAGLPTTATVTLATQGTLPVGISIGSIVAVFNYPPNVQVIPATPADPTADPPVPAVPETFVPLITPVSVVPSGVAPLATTTIAQNLTIFGQVTLAPLRNPIGITTGEFATVTFAIAQPTNPALPRFIPTAAGFTKNVGFTVLDLTGNQIFGFNDSNFILGPVIIQ